MPHVKYTGRADARVIDAAAWKRAGVEDQGKVTWDESNDFTVEVNDAAATLLGSGSDFQIVTDGESSPLSDEDDASTTTRASRVKK